MTDLVLVLGLVSLAGQFCLAGFWVARVHCSTDQGLQCNAWCSMAEWRFVRAMFVVVKGGSIEARLLKLL